MPNIIVSYKWVMDEQDIRVNADNQELDFSRAKKKISDYDKNAIEIATQVFEAQGGSLTAISYGTGDVKNSLKDALSRGPEQAFWVNDENAAAADSYVTANVLAAAVKKVGEFDLLICADGSSDAGNQQFANRVAALLGVPAITSVAELTSVENGTVTAKRRLGDVFETVKVTGPAVYAVLPEVASPRFPSIKQLMGAKKKPQTEVPVAELGLSAEELTPKAVVKEVKGYTNSRKNIIFKDGDVAAQAQQLAEALAKDGVL